MTVELLLVLGDGGLLTGRRCGILPMGVVESLNGHFYREAQLVDLPAACLGGASSSWDAVGQRCGSYRSLGRFSSSKTFKTAKND